MKIQTKYKNGDHVWFMYGNKPNVGMVEKITVTEYYNKHAGVYNTYVNYSITVGHSLMVFDEKLLFKSYQEIIKSLEDEAKKL